MNTSEQLSVFSSPASPPTLTWKEVLDGERDKEYFKNALTFVESERRAGKIIYPPNAEVFNALQYTPFAELSVVIIGQDPYHGPDQAHGLCFSVRPGVALPPSLQNIYKEIESDIGCAMPPHGNLEKWARQGVLLLNASLTVEAGRPQSHANIGWEIFTDRVISEINAKKSGIVFLLWGSHAQKKGQHIDATRHFILRAPHPSPLSAHRGFFGCKHFSKTNGLLRKLGRPEIDWQI